MILPTLLPGPVGLSTEDTAHLTDLFAKGTPVNTIRTWESGLAYLAAWRRLRFGAGLDWPERDDVALAFLLDHSRDLTQTAATDPARACGGCARSFSPRRRDCSRRDSASWQPSSVKVLLERAERLGLLD